MSFLSNYSGVIQVHYRSNNNQQYKVSEASLGDRGGGVSIYHDHEPLSKMLDRIYHLPCQNNEEYFNTLKEDLEKVQKCSTAIVSTFSVSKYSTTTGTHSYTSSRQKYSQWVQNEVDNDRQIVKALQKLMVKCITAKQFSVNLPNLGIPQGEEVDLGSCSTAPIL